MRRRVLLFLPFLVWIGLPTHLAAGDCEGERGNEYYLWGSTSFENCQRTETMTLPRGRQFLILMTEETRWSGASSVDGELRISAGGRTIYDHSTGPAQGQVAGTDWTLDIASCVDACCHCTGGRYEIHSRWSTKLLDISEYTQEGPIEMEVYWAGHDTALSFLLWANTRLALTQTPHGFRPRDGREPDVARCSEHEKECHPAYRAKFTGLEPADVMEQFPERFEFLKSIVMGFEIEHPQGVERWLPGDSTNGGKDLDSDPDYVLDQEDGRNPAEIFESPQGKRQIRTKKGVQEATLTVTPQDYGGVANLRGWIEFGAGKKFEAEIVAADIEPNHFTPPVEPQPPACAGEGQFASLPIDEDCNGIADSWEEAYKSEPGYSAAADLESGGELLGDGLTVHDEYRGFHYDWSSADTDEAERGIKRWTSADPNKKDVFLWDTSGDVYTTALKTILARATSAFVYRRVQKEYANPKGAGVDRINRNSRPNSRISTKALVFRNDRVVDPPGYGDAHGLFNNGAPIAIDEDRLQTDAAAFGFPVEVLRAAVLAHESGHKFTLNHYLNRLQFTSSVPAVSPATSLTFQQYALADPPPGRLTLGRYTRYASVENTRRSDDVILTDRGAVQGNRTGITLDPVFEGVSEAILQHYWFRPISPVGQEIHVWRQWGRIMDAIPRVLEREGSLRSAQNWEFHPGDSANGVQPDADQMCVQCDAPKKRGN